MKLDTTFLLLAFYCVWGLSNTAVGAETPERRPNIVLIMADDFGYECVTCNGGQSYQTPRLDAMAAAGMRFTECHSQPVCTPTRVQIMTGRSNARNYWAFGSLHLPSGTTGNSPDWRIGFS